MFASSWCFTFAHSEKIWEHPRQISSPSEGFQTISQWLTIHQCRLTTIHTQTSVYLFWWYKATLTLFNEGLYETDQHWSLIICKTSLGGALTFFFNSNVPRLFPIPPTVNTLITGRPLSMQVNTNNLFSACWVIVSQISLKDVGTGGAGGNESDKEEKKENRHKGKTGERVYKSSIQDKSH